MILDDIVRVKKRELQRAKDERKPADLRAKARSAAPLKPFDLQSDRVSIIAEIKRASPAKGAIRADLDPAKLAKEYEKHGAKAISVLTDREFFQGSVEDLRQARLATNLPVLRKDFVIDEYQLLEARVMLADCALLIARILEKNQLAEYVEFARELGLATLVEVHHERELEQVTNAKIVGINNRDLDTFKVDLATTARLRPLVPPGVIVVSESGISKREDLELLRHLKVDAALVGEELVRAPEKLKEWMS